jgi:hypothetical protein
MFGGGVVEAAGLVKLGERGLWAAYRALPALLPCSTRPALGDPLRSH